MMSHRMQNGRVRWVPLLLSPAIRAADGHHSSAHKDPVTDADDTNSIVPPPGANHAGREAVRRWPIARSECSHCLIDHGVRQRGAQRLSPNHCYFRKRLEASFDYPSQDSLFRIASVSMESKQREDARADSGRIYVSKLDMYSMNGGVAVGFNPPRVIGALAAPDRAVAMALFTKWLFGTSLVTSQKNERYHITDHRISVFRW